MSQIPERYNSFSHNIQRVITNQVNELALLNAIQKSAATSDLEVTYEYEDNNQIIHEFSLPSYTAMVNRLRAIETSIHNLQTGTGSIETNGNRTQVKLVTHTSPPQPISTIISPTTFNVNPQWFFADLMFPHAYVTVDLAGMLDQKTKQVQICRIIVDNQVEYHQSSWNNTYSKQVAFSYQELEQSLINEGIPYFVDQQTIDLSLSYTTKAGTFRVEKEPERRNDGMYYTLDSLNYNTYDKNGKLLNSNEVLKPKDEILYQNALFSVGNNIDYNTREVCLDIKEGSAIISQYSELKLYTDPTFQKKAYIKFGAHEYNFIFIRPISHDYNVVATDWSYCIKFNTDTLLFEEDGNQIPFINYYNKFVLDWGTKLKEEAQLKKISALQGKKPTTPYLNKGNFSSVLINKHLFSDIIEYNNKLENANTQYKIAKQEYSRILTEYNEKNKELQEILKSIDNSFEITKLKMSISVLEIELEKAKTALINSELQLTKIQQSKPNNTVIPKYRVQGIIDMPENVYIDTMHTMVQEIIQFEVAYTYIKTGDNIDESNLNYELTTLPLRERIIDPVNKTIKWCNIEDNLPLINYLNISIQPGETLVFKVRTITEAGYPDAPLKSDWSNLIAVSCIAEKITEVEENLLDYTEVREALQSMLTSEVYTSIKDMISEQFKAKTSDSTNIDSTKSISSNNLTVEELLKKYSTSTDDVKDIIASKKMQALLDKIIKK